MSTEPDQRTLDLTVGEFLQAYNAAAPAKCQLDLNDSETLELIAGEESCDYDFFFYDEEAASYVFFGLSCLGDTPALDQPVESLFVSEDVVLSSPVLPQPLSAALSALPCGEKARQTLLDFLASAEGGETTLSAEFPGCQMYYSLSPRSDGKADLSAGIYPAYGD